MVHHWTAVLGAVSFLLASVKNAAFAFTARRHSPRRPSVTVLRAQRYPSLVVFDLDNTLWTPELYQLRRRRNMQLPTAHQDVKLFPGAQHALAWLENTNTADIRLAVASRTKSGEWAHHLLEQFGLTERFCDVQIFPGNKQTHFSNIQQNTGIPYNEMLFFDDARDGKYGNCVPVSEMGVLCCHCPGGIDSKTIFDTALDRFHEWDGAPRTIVEWDGTVTQWGSLSDERYQGTVKRVFYDKGYGFLQYSESRSQDLFFHFNDLPQATKRNVEVGDEMSFVVGKNRGKPLAQKIEIMKSTASEHQVSMRAFSMNMPFAALLANGYKDLETRNGTMFVPYEQGTKFLLQVGQRTYPDGNRHLEIMKSGGLSDDKIESLKSLPAGFGKGMAVAIMEVGETYETTVEERSDPEMQRRIGAYGAESGMRCTEIRRIEYLKKPVRIKGSGGVFKVNVNKDVIPEGWLEDRR